MLQGLPYYNYWIALRTEFRVHSRVEAPPPKIKKTNSRDGCEGVNRLLMDRDLQENPNLWPLPNYEELR